MKLAVELNSAEINALQYPVVVEMWDKAKSGRIRRAFLEEFSPSERQKAAYWYKKFYRWYLVKGTPETAVFKPETLHFVKRLCNFFGTV